MGKSRRRTPKIKWVNINGTMQPLIEEEDDEVPANLAARLLPIYSVGVGGGLAWAVYTVMPGNDLQMYGGVFLAGVLLVPAVYAVGNRLFKLIKLQIIPPALRVQRDLDKHRITEEIQAQERIRSLELHNQRMELGIRRAEIHLRTVIQEAAIQRVISNGEVRRDAPDRAAEIDVQRQKWQMEVIGVLFSPEHIEKTKKGTWTGGQPVSMKKLGRKRYGLLKDAGLIYESGKHAQWKHEEAPDEHSAMTALERIGAFEITEAWG